MIIINGERWRVRRIPPSHPVLVYKTGAPAIGCCDDITKTIYLSYTLSPAMTKRVLCHEIVHAFMYSYNVPLTDEVEEIVANIIDTYGYSIISWTNAAYDNLK